ncbi:unnamed protein product [Callosobruchus maculatus]|uniref:Uncharacterized protein n=1 Tax=Callosobruchus maculatus TaxID=64391 RepID=A0A653C1I7_CALMS|nr:unnamed protein product [Callosobruchus maculatus]
MRRTTVNKRILQPKEVVAQNTSNKVQPPQSKKRKASSLFEDEEPVTVEDDESVKKKYVEKFRMSFNPSSTNSKSYNSVSDSGARLRLFSGECVDVGVQCEAMVERKDAEVQCISVPFKDTGLQSESLMDKENTKCKCQLFEQQLDLLSLMNRCANTPTGKNKDLNQLIKLCKKLISKPSTELKNNQTASEQNNNRISTLRKRKNDTIVHTSQILPERQSTVKKQKTKGTFVLPATPNKTVIPSRSISNSNGNTPRERGYQRSQSLTLAARKTRKLFSPTTWERSKRYSEMFVTDPKQHNIFL